MAIYIDWISKNIERVQSFIDEKFDELKVKACYGQDSLPRAYRSLSQEDCLNIYKMCL